jgi:hypothetical protein
MDPHINPSPRWIFELRTWTNQKQWNVFFTRKTIDNSPVPSANYCVLSLVSDRDWTTSTWAWFQTDRVGCLSSSAKAAVGLSWHLAVSRTELPWNCRHASRFSCLTLGIGSVAQCYQSEGWWHLTNCAERLLMGSEINMSSLTFHSWCLTVICFIFLSHSPHNPNSVTFRQALLNLEKRNGQQQAIKALQNDSVSTVIWQISSCSA